MNAHMWHGGTANRTGGAAARHACDYTRWDKPQQQYRSGLLDAGVHARLTGAAPEILALDDKV